MTKREAAILELYTDTIMLTGKDRQYVYDYAKELMGRPVYTHEFSCLWDELKDKSEADFFNLCKNLTEEEFWLLCKDCTPLEGHEVWITPKTTDKVYRGIYTEHYGKGNNDCGFICDEGFMWYNTGLAWMYVIKPKAYDPKGDENNDY